MKALLFPSRFLRRAFQLEVKFFQSNKLSKIFWFFFAASASEKMTH
jgi:hypothetical protein